MNVPGRDGQSQPLVTLDEKCDAIVSCGNVSELIELPPMETVLGELEAWEETAYLADGQ